MKKSVSAFLLFMLTLSCFSQKTKLAPPPAKTIARASLSKTDLQKAKLIEDSLKLLAVQMMGDTMLDNRRKACYTFIPKMVSALKLPNSFYYPFDSLETLSKVYAPDSSFRIFTWQVYFTVPAKLSAQYSKTGKEITIDKPVIRYYGFIQMRGKELKMFPLYDAGDTLSYGTEQILTHNNWWGQLYYNVIQKTVQGKSYYTLFGFEAADQMSRRKIIDILSFDSKGNPQFGAPLFYFKYTDSAKIKNYDTLSRFFIEYKWNATTTLNYNREMEMIVFDHVTPPNNKAKGATFTYVPDGTYEGFVWMNNRWNWVEKVFTFAIDENDNPPIPAPLFGTPKKQPELRKENDY